MCKRYQHLGLEILQFSLKSLEYALIAFYVGTKTHHTKKTRLPRKAETSNLRYDSLTHWITNLETGYVEYDIKPAAVIIVTISDTSFFWIMQYNTH